MTKEQHAALAKAAGFEPEDFCWYCLNGDPLVEAAGVWFCPNPRCGGPGGGQSRHVMECSVCDKEELLNGVILHQSCIVFQTNHASIPDDAEASA